MTHALRSAGRVVLVALLLGAMTWGGIQVLLARRTCRAVADLVSSASPNAAGLSADALSLINLASDSLRFGNLREAQALLCPHELSTGEQDAARRFLASQPALRKRIVAAVDEARQREEDGASAVAVRAALTVALRAASQQDTEGIETALVLAERAAKAAPSGSEAARGGRSQALAMAQSLAPALRLEQDVLAEGYGPAQRLAARAAEAFRREQYAQAIGLMDLAGSLLASPPASDASPSGAVPEWLDVMAEQDSSLDVVASADQCRTVVDFCQTVAQAQQLSRPVQRIVRQARRALDQGQPSEARWWAGIALDAMGVSQDSVPASMSQEARP